MTSIGGTYEIYKPIVEDKHSKEMSNVSNFMKLVHCSRDMWGVGDWLPASSYLWHTLAHPLSRHININN